MFGDRTTDLAIRAVGGSSDSRTLIIHDVFY